MSLVRIGRQGKLILKWKYFARILLSLQAITIGKRKEIECLPTEHFDILPYNMSIPAGVPLLLPQFPWFSNGAKGLGRCTLRYFWDVTKMPLVQSILLCSLRISHYCLVLKWVPHKFGCKFNSFHTNGTWLKHKNKNTTFLKRKFVVRFIMWQKCHQKLTPPYCCWLPPPPPPPLPAAPDTPYITTECDQVPSC